MEQVQHKKVGKLNINDKIYNIFEEISPMGSSGDATININDLNVSRNHAIIITNNGTYCDDKKNVPFKLYEIKHNTSIKLGDVEGSTTHNATSKSPEDVAIPGTPQLIKHVNFKENHCRRAKSKEKQIKKSCILESKTTKNNVECAVWKVETSTRKEQLSRVARRGKVKVVLTMMDDPQVKSLIRELGGSIAESVETCTVLVTEHIERSQKLLCAIGLGKPICSPKWILDSKKAHEFLDPWNYILKDIEAETRWNFALEDSLKRSREHKLLENYRFIIRVTPVPDVLMGAIVACGGKVTKIPSKRFQNTFVISSAEYLTKHKKILKQYGDIKLIAPEAIFDGVLRQELRLSNYYLI